MIWQNIKNALISIRSAKLRSFLTVMGVVIGVFAVLVMVAAGDGVKAQIGGQVSSLGTNVLTITSGKVGQSSTAKNGQQQKQRGAAAGGEAAAHGGRASATAPQLHLGCFGIDSRRGLAHAAQLLQQHDDAAIAACGHIGAAVRPQPLSEGHEQPAARQ